MIESLKMVLNPRLSSEIDIKKATKSFGQKFACGTSVTGDDEIIIQGDVKDDVIDFIQEKWPEV
jgi:density-regulated protein DRP1